MAVMKMGSLCRLSLFLGEILNDFAPETVRQNIPDFLLLRSIYLNMN